MIVICCKKVIIDIENKNLVEGLSFEGSHKEFRVKEKKKKNTETLVIISFVETIIKKMIFDHNTFVISPKIILKENYKINLSNDSPPGSRKPSVSNIYGLAGLSGLPGYNLSLISGNIICKDNFKNFTSRGGKGGDGQQGSPGGVGGTGGKGGKLIINGECIKVGNQGSDGISLGDSKVGLIPCEENMEGIDITAKSFSHFTYSSLSLINEAERKEFFKLF